MSNKGQLLQDPFLNTLRKEHIPVSIYLVNGIKLQGQIDCLQARDLDRCACARRQLTDRPERRRLMPVPLLFDV